MAEGMRAILASGVLQEHGADDACDRGLGGGHGDYMYGRSRRGGAVDGIIRNMRCHPRSLEYFDAQEGGWKLVRNESDW